MDRIRTLILGAAGRDFHTFNLVHNGVVTLRTSGTLGASRQGFEDSSARRRHSSSHVKGRITVPGTQVQCASQTAGSTRFGASVTETV